MKKPVAAFCIVLVLVVGSIFIGTQEKEQQMQEVGGGDSTVNTLNPIVSTSSPFTAVTTRVFGRNLYFPGATATTSRVYATTFCINLVTPDCITAWPAGGSGGSGMATTSIDTETELEDVVTDVANFYSDNDTVPVADGGTGANSFTSSQLLYGAGTGALQSVATGTLSATSPLSVSASRFLVGGAAALSFDFSVANSWTGLQTFANASTTGYHTFGTASSTNWTGGGLTDCDADNQTVSYDATTMKFGCGDDDNSGGGGGSGNIATTTADQANYLAAFTTDSATPAGLGVPLSTGTSTLLSHLIIGSSTAQSMNLLQIVPTRTYQDGTYTNGAVNIKNDFNNRAAVNIHSANGAGQLEGLVELQINNTAWDKPVFHIISSAVTSEEEVRIDAPEPEMAFVENDQVSPEGKYEFRVQNDLFEISGRNAADSGFEEILKIERIADGGAFRLFGSNGINLNRGSSQGTRVAWGTNSTAQGNVQDGIECFSRHIANNDADFECAEIDSTAASTSLFYINSSGPSIGIGTTTPNWGALTLTSGTMPQLLFSTGSAANPLFYMRAWNNLFALGTSTATATNTPAMLTINSDSGTTTLSSNRAGTSTDYYYSSAAGKGGSIILEDTDGAGCTELTTLNGAATFTTVTCPTEI